MSQQLITALMFGAFALGFAVIWRSHSHLRCAGLWALSYVSAAFGFLFDHMFLVEKSLKFLTPLGDTFYMISPALLTAGLAVRYGRKIPDLALLLIVMMTIMQAYWFWFIKDNFVLRTEIITYACAAMFAMGAHVVYARMRTNLDKALCVVMSAFAAQFVITTFASVYLWPEAVTAESFQQSNYIEVLHFSTAFTAVSLALLLFVGLFGNIRQKQADLSTESDRTVLAS